MSASKGDVWAEVCAREQAVRFDAKGLCCEHTRTKSSPIDDFYQHLSLLVQAGKQEALAANEALGRVLLLGLVSGTELYFRSLLAELINVCPIARSAAKKQPVPLGAVDYYGKEVGFGLLENVSISTSGEIKRQTTRIAGIEIPNRSSVAEAVAEFEKLCELRHAATHARGHLGHHNVRELGIESTGKPLALNISFAGLQDAAAICQNLVRAYNRFLFRRTIERWISEGSFTGVWKKDGKNFSRLFHLFHSAQDAAGPLSANSAYASLRPVLAKAMAKAAISN